MSIVAGAASGSNADTTAAIIALAVVVVVALVLAARRWLWPRLSGSIAMKPGITLAGVVVLAAGIAVAVVVAVGPPSTARSDALASNPNLDPGTPLFRAAPNFTLSDQFGRRVSLTSFRGKVVLLAFNDSQCTTICPLTTTAMLDAKAMLGKAASRVQLLGIDANPDATSRSDVFAYSQLHGMLDQWHFTTGSLTQLKQVWKAYGIEVAIEGGQIDHTPALFVIDPQGRERKLYMTQQSYAAIGQLGQVVAQEVSSLLPGHPTVDSHLSYSRIAGVGPGQTVSLPSADGGTIKVGPGKPRVYAFFATWDQGTTALAAGLGRLAQYDQLAAKDGLPRVTAVDEGSVEPPGALQRLLSALHKRLPFPVGVDRSGQLGDGYEVQNLPWLMTVSASGRIAWYDSFTNDTTWPDAGRLATLVKAALARVPATARSTAQQLAGSPAPLAAIHAQAAQLLGGEPALAARIRALRGYPIVINAWASWCAPCRAEFGLFASASARYGRRVAFLGADTDDSSGDAQAFLHQHPVSYPSYQTTRADITDIVPQGLAGTPSTIFINRTGKVVFVHVGQYDSQGTLDADIGSYALSG